MRYALGRDFETLEAHGSARTTGIFMQQPLITGRHFRLEARLQYEDRQLRDDIDMFSQRHAKRIRLGTASLSANGEDSLFGGGRSAAYISYSHGSLRLETEAQRIRDRALNRSAGGFGKLNLTPAAPAAPVRPLHAVRADQRPARHQEPDSSEQFSLGGPYGVRAYANGSSSGDSGWQASLELRYVPMAGLQFAAFADAGRVQLSQRPWTDERNQRRLSAAGLSITQAGPSHQVMAAMAWPIQRENEQNGPKQEPRFGYAPRATSDRPPPSAAAPCHAESGTSSNPRRNPMNKTHTVIWNASKACWTVASECARRRGKSGVSGARAVLAAVAPPD